MIEDQIPILDFNGNTVQDAVSTFILTISLHFVRDPSALKIKILNSFPTLDVKNLVTSNGTKTLSSLVSYSEKIQTNISRKKSSLLDYQPF
jgi:hypothetical protein